MNDLVQLKRERGIHVTVLDCLIKKLDFLEGVTWIVFVLPYLTEGAFRQEIGTQTIPSL